MNVRFSIIAYHISISVSYFDQQKMYVHIKWQLLTAIHNKCELVLYLIFISVALYFVLCELSENQMRCVIETPLKWYRCAL